VRLEATRRWPAGRHHRSAPLTEFLNLDDQALQARGPRDSGAYRQAEPPGDAAFCAQTIDGARKFIMALAPPSEFSTQLSDDYCPPAPVPRDEAMGIIALIRSLATNPLECWTREHFDRPIARVGLPVGEAVLVHEPTAIRRVFLDNTANYRKDALQPRVLWGGLADGLPSAEGGQGHVQRRTLAPMFARRAVTNFAPAMVSAADALVNRWVRSGDGARVDVAAEMTRTTLDVLERTIFSDGLGCEAERFRVAMGTYFNTLGRIDP